MFAFEPDDRANRAAVGYRWAGSLAIAFRMIASSPLSISGLIEDGAGGSSCVTCIRIWSGVGASKGGRLVTSEKSVAPSE